MTPCLLDANVFITAKREHYRFAVCPGYWEWLVRAHLEGNVYSIDRVHDELLKASDELSKWAQNLPNSFFLPVGTDVVAAATKVSAWVVGQNYPEQSINRFFGGADLWLIAHAMVRGWRVVTHERSAALGNKIKIPDVCKEMGVESLTPFQMLEQFGARFVL